MKSPADWPKAFYLLGAGQTPCVCFMVCIYLLGAECPLCLLAHHLLPSPLLWDDQEPLSKAVSFPVHPLCGYWTLSLGTSIRHKAGTSQGGSSSQDQQHCLNAMPSLCRTAGWNRLQKQALGTAFPSLNRKLPGQQLSRQRSHPQHTTVQEGGGGSGAAAELKYSLEI